MSKSASAAIYLNTPQSRKLLSWTDHERFEAMAVAEVSEAARSIVQMAFAFVRKNLTSIGWLIGNTAFWSLNAGFCQVIILNVCCLMILIQKCWRPESDQAARRRAGHALIIFALHVVIACDIVSVLIDQASPASLY